MRVIPDKLRGKAELIKGNLRTIVELLNSKGYKNLYIDGGKTIQSFLKQDMIDELIITRIPIILGSGIPLFTEMDSELKLELVETEILSNALVKSRYLRKKDH
jgi:dihydrofolate reductase